VTATIASLSKNGHDVIPTILKALESLKQENSCFALSLPSALCEADNIQTLKEANFCSAVAIGRVFPKHLKRFAPQFTRIGNVTSLLEGTLYCRSDTPSSTVQIFLPNERAVENLLKESEGDFAVFSIEPGKILAARDPVGVEPLYYGENDELLSLATNRRALWKLGIQDSCSFPSGNLAIVRQKGFEFKPIKSLHYSKPKQITLDEAARTLQELLEQSTRVRVRDVKELAVAFSGGLDSSVVAFLAKRCGVSVWLFHVSLCGQSETEDAKRAADELKLPLSVHLFESSDVEETVPKVIRLIEESDPVKAAIGTPFYWVAHKTAEAGLDVLLAGQGADELFGGYQRYINEYISHGEAAVRKVMFNDVVRLPVSNLERDKKICGFHGVDLRLPFASFGLAEFALSLPVDLKIERKENGLRKLVLRRLAQNLGLPEPIVNKSKKAMQYATGVNAVIGKIARRQGLTVGEYIEKVFRKEKVDG